MQHLAGGTAESEALRQEVEAARQVEEINFHHEIILQQEQIVKELYFEYNKQEVSPNVGIPAGPWRIFDGPPPDQPLIPEATLVASAKDSWPYYDDGHFSSHLAGVVEGRAEGKNRIVSNIYLNL